MIQKPETFKCRHCGYCCTQIVVLSKKDIDRIKKLGYREEDFVEKDRQGRKRIRMPNYYCYFLGLRQGKTFCRIYDARPETCRKYPFFRGCTAECMPPKLFDDRII